MTIASKYFEVIQDNGIVTFIQVNDFVNEFIKQCTTKGIKVKLVLCNGFCKVVKVKQNRFYIQKLDYNYSNGSWSWKLYAKAETYENAMKRINNNMYSHCGDKVYRILDRQENIYY
jgi:cobalamin biosynthesis protein CbiD